MKDHVEEERDADLGDEIPVEAAIAILKQAAEGLTSARIVRGWDIRVVGWRPMTDREREAARKRRERSKHANAVKKAKQEADERKLFEALREKYGE